MRVISSQENIIFIRGVYPLSQLFDVSNKTVIVTGAGRGIGKSIALGFAAAGANVVLCSRTDKQLENVADEIIGLGQKAVVVPCDVTKADDIENVVKVAIENFGQIDVLVNNAGMTFKKPAIDLELDDWNKIIAVNLTGVFSFTKRVGKEMIKQKHGKIINISSVAAKLGIKGSIAYCASKGGLDMLTKTFALEWAEHEIQVNGVAPAYIETPLIKAAKEANNNFESLAHARTPMGRLGQPDEIVGATLMLASKASSYITGETILIDGGWSAYGL